MDSIVLAFAIYLIRIKRWQRFEWTIIVCMFLRHAMNAFHVTNKFEESFEFETSSYILWFSISATLGPIYHWIYASQYLKTSFLTRGIVKKAILLFQRHKTDIENNSETISYWSDFVSQHGSIDEAMNLEKARAKAIRRNFFFIDIILMAILPCIEGLPLYVYDFP